MNVMEELHVFLRDILLNKKSVLILSTGGGNDYIGAYMITKLIAKHYPKIDLAFASSIEVNEEYEPLIKLNNNLFTISDYMPTFDFDIKNHSIRLISQGIKNENMNLPYFVAINKNKPVETKLAYRELFDEVTPDCVITVDNGGDSITGGLDGEKGFDQTNLKALLEMGERIHHLVIGPGCDGESSLDDFNRYILINSEKFRGIFDIGQAVDSIYSNVKHNSEVMLQMDHRWSTMRIIIEASEKVKQGYGDVLFTVPRHKKDQKFPFKILQSTLVFSYN